jgi:hypothetical protein
MKNIAREALPVLANNLVFPNLIHQDYSTDFVGKGETIQIEKPPVYEANDFSGTITIQDSNLSAVEVTMDKLADVSVEVSSKDLSLSVPDFVDKVSGPMAVALAEKINAEGLQLVRDIPYFSGESGETPDGLDDFSAVRKGLNMMKAPSSDRSAVWDVDADTKFTEINNLIRLNESGEAKALREGEIGKIYGLSNYYSQDVYVHTAGGATAATSPQVAGEVDAGDTTMAIDASSMTGSLKKGDLMTIAGNTYVVTADTDAASSNAIASVSFYPAAPAGGIEEDEDIVFADSSEGGSVRNVGFHKNAFAFVTRALAMPSDADGFVTSYNGITLRVVRSYDITSKKEIMSMDVLYGFKTIYPELAHVRLG